VVAYVEGRRTDEGEECYHVAARRTQRLQGLRCLRLLVEGEDWLSGLDSLPEVLRRYKSVRRTSLIVIVLSNATTLSQGIHAIVIWCLKVRCTHCDECAFIASQVQR